MSWESSDRRKRLPKDWPARVAHVLARDRRICHVCGLPGADQVDHVRNGDDHSESNLAAIHDNPCHRHKSALEGVAARNPNRPPERHPGLI